MRDPCFAGTGINSRKVYTGFYTDRYKSERRMAKRFLSRGTVYSVYRNGKKFKEIF